MKHLAFCLTDPRNLPTSSRRSFTAGCLALALALVTMLGPSNAWAHCWPVEQEPAAGSNLKQAPKEIRIRFNTQLHEGSVQLEAIGSQKTILTPTPGSVEPTQTDTLHVELGTLSPGAYRVRWRATTPDGHESEGDYRFDLRP